MYTALVRVIVLSFWATALLVRYPKIWPAFNFSPAMEGYDDFCEASVYISPSCQMRPVRWKTAVLHCVRQSRFMFAQYAMDYIVIVFAINAVIQTEQRCFRGLPNLSSDTHRNQLCVFSAVDLGRLDWYGLVDVEYWILEFSISCKRAIGVIRTPPRDT